jgi:hypothetical protein
LENLHLPCVIHPSSSRWEVNTSLPSGLDFISCFDALIAAFSA